MNELSEMCLYYRAKNGMTQTELGKACGLSRYVIIKVEQGKSVSKLTEAKIRLAIGCQK